MSEEPSRKRLGRGLAALIGEMDQPAGAPPARPSAGERRVPIELVSPNPNNPRRVFSEADLADLAQSIREHGIVQPVVLRPSRESGRFEIIAGERRWRAAQRAGLAEIPAIVRDVDDRTALELAIIENVQRADLNPLEEAAGYQQLLDQHGYTQVDLAQVIGKSRSHVANTLRLLKLPQDVRSMLSEGLLSAGHARTLVTAQNPAQLAHKIISEGLSVRQAESLAQASTDQPPKAGKAPAAPKDADTLALEKLLSDVTGLAVTVMHKQSGGREGGEVRIAYRSLEQLDEICRRLQA
jgi:ParB family chromosome partitioning protein